MSRTQELVHFFTNFSLKKVPPGAIKQAKILLMDQFAVTIGGIHTRASIIARQFSRQYFGQGKCLTFGENAPASLLGAAWSNGVTGSSLDMDEGNNLAMGHPSAVVFPALLALAEEEDLSGQEFIEAYIMAYEVAARISMSRCGEITIASGTWGGVGAALGGALLLKLSGEEARHALEIALCHMPKRPRSTQRNVIPMVKECVGWSSLAGISAPLLAQRGMTGLYGCLDDDSKYTDTMVQGLGRDYVMTQGYLKPYAACRWTHAAIDGVRRIVMKHEIPDTGKISGITVGTFYEATELANRTPATSEEAQYSIPWTVACMLIEGEVGPRQIAEEKLKDVELLDLAGKVTVKLDDVSEDLFPAVRRAVVKVFMEDGRVLREEVEGVRGDFTSPMSREELNDKHWNLMEPTLGEKAAEEILRRIREIRKEEKIRSLTHYIRDALST